MLKEIDEKEEEEDFEKKEEAADEYTCNNRVSSDV